MKGVHADVLSDEAAKAKISRRGAELAFQQLSLKFGNTLFERVPKMWEFIAGGLLAAFQTGMMINFILEKAF